MVALTHVPVLLVRFVWSLLTLATGMVLGQMRDRWTARHEKMAGVASLSPEPTEEEEEQKNGPAPVPAGRARRLDASALDAIDDEVQSESEEAQLKPRAVVVVDPVSTGANVADAFLRRGVAVIAVSTSKELALPTLPGLRTDYLARLDFDSADPDGCVQAVRSLPAEVLGVVAGCELAVHCSDYLTQVLGLPTNGTLLSEARRDKFLMQETIRAAGVRAVQQQRASSWEEVESFARSATFPLIVKPVRSAGSDCCIKCGDMAELQRAFDQVAHRRNALGELNTAVLVQQFLEGGEYVVDTVSRNGVHKVVAVWLYDKSAHGGADFVYRGTGSVSGDSPEARAIVPYTLRVLDAMGIRHGAGHAEVMLTPTGPCLVEIGARPHGGEGSFVPLADRCWGYNQVEALVAATLAPGEFDALPAVCGAERQRAYKVDFISDVSGRIKRIQHLEQMQQLDSFVQFDLLPAIGDYLPVTIDCFTACGSVSLAHADADQLQRDLERVREWEKDMWVVDEAEEQ